MKITVYDYTDAEVEVEWYSGDAYVTIKPKEKALIKVLQALEPEQTTRKEGPDYASLTSPG